MGCLDLVGKIEASRSTVSLAEGPDERGFSFRRSYVLVDGAASSDRHQGDRTDFKLSLQGKQYFSVVGGREITLKRTL